MLARPKNVPICGPRLRELSNVVFEQQVAHQFETRQDAWASRGRSASGSHHVTLPNNENFKGPHRMAANFRSHKVGEK